MVRTIETQAEKTLESRPEPSSEQIEEFRFNDRVVGGFIWATCFWGCVAGLLTAATCLLLIEPDLMAGAPEFSFGRIRSIHLNLALWAFAGNALFAGIYFSTQRLCRRPMWSEGLGRLHFFGWQIICVWALFTLARGHVQHRSHLELVWPIDVAIAVVWGGFAVNFLMTVFRRRERYMYISLWFYIASVVAVIPVHILSNLVLPSTGYASDSMLGPTEDAFLQSWGWQNLLMYMLTLPFLGVMYYFVPKISGRPVANYRLAIIQFWAMTFLGTFAGSRLLHYTPVPEWLTSLGMLAGILMLLPSWVGVTNGLGMLKGTLRDAADSPVLKFFLVGILFYALVCLESGLLSVKSWGAFANLTDWNVARSFALIFGWAAFLAYGAIYWMLPRVLGAPLWNLSWVQVHFWIATTGTLLLVVGAYGSGYVQGSMANQLDSVGMLVYPEFIEIVQSVTPWWWATLTGICIVLAGLVVLTLNVTLTWMGRDKNFERPIQQVAGLTGDYQDPPLPKSDLEGTPILQTGVYLDVWSRLVWHRRWERSAVKFTAMVALSVMLGMLIEVTPLIWTSRTAMPTAAATPYTPLELAGQHIYVREGCAGCHTQTVRPLVAETKRYGEFSRLEHFVYDRPVQWGSRRVGPDLAQEGGKQNGYWHWKHLDSPSTENPGSVMPSFSHLLEKNLEMAMIQDLLREAIRLGIPYDLDLLEDVEISEEDRWAGERTPLEQIVQAQAEVVAADIVKSGGPAAMFDREATALIAYLQRLGTSPQPLDPSAIEGLAQVQ